MWSAGLCGVLGLGTNMASLNQCVVVDLASYAVGIIRFSLKCAKHLKERRYGRHEAEDTEAWPDGRRLLDPFDYRFWRQPRGSGAQPIDGQCPEPC